MKIGTKKWWAKLPPHEAKEIKRDLVLMGLAFAGLLLCIIKFYSR